MGDVQPAAAHGDSTADDLTADDLTADDLTADDLTEHMVHEHRDVQGGAARAAVFGVSDGLVSNVALILGVAAAASDGSAVLIAGVSGLLAGAASMAAGEYVSVRAQVELIERELAIERVSLAERPRLETAELTAIYQSRGIDAEQARAMATAVMADPEVALEVHAREELGVDPDGGGNALVAAGSSFVAFAIGAALPLAPWFVAVGTAATVASALVGLVATAAVGVTLAHFTERSAFRTAARQVSLATAACVLTWLIGSVMGATVV
jgi:VIT1/CCC1 family predicted Fe2+/Mn2+ transporter